ncbi:uncharacterized protein LOC133803545 [Humulus lupulus]|uniref:uncharacterized protein LOC133803545 n=1 Tax=Humulus lupulus TaxID=3486 RepID=UPI002B416566|nr:uncharacterized protein LOC133803545 [Humulus lupulus]
MPQTLLANFQIKHAQHLTLGTANRFGELGIIASVQNLEISCLEKNLDMRLGVVTKETKPGLTVLTSWVHGRSCHCWVHGRSCHYNCPSAAQRIAWHKKEFHKEESLFCAQCLIQPTML